MNYNVTLDGYTGVSALRFWCQKVLPLVFDDSLSYYELLNKVVKYLNDIISDLTTVEGNVDALHNAYQQLVEAYEAFTEDVNNKVDEALTNSQEALDIVSAAEGAIRVLTVRAENAATSAEGYSTTAVTASQSAAQSQAAASASATQAATSAAAAQMVSPIIYDFEASSGEIIPASANTVDWSTFKNNVINGRAIVRLEITRPNGAEQTLIFRPNYLAEDGTSTTPATTEESITAGVILSELQSTTIITILWTSAEELERGLYIIKSI